MNKAPRLQRLQAPPRRAARRSIVRFGKAHLDARVRELMLASGERDTWPLAARVWGVSKGRAYLIAHGQRPVPACCRLRYRALYGAPGKMRKFLKRVAVPFLQSRQARADGRYTRRP